MSQHGKQKSRKETLGARWGWWLHEQKRSRVGKTLEHTCLSYRS